MSKGFYKINRQNCFFLVFLSKHHKNISKTYIWPWSLFGLWHTNPPTSVSVFYLFPAPSAKRQTPKQIDAPPLPPLPLPPPQIHEILEIQHPKSIDTPAYLYLASPFLYVWASPKKALYNNKKKVENILQNRRSMSAKLIYFKKNATGFYSFFSISRCFSARRVKETPHTNVPKKRGLKKTNANVHVQNPSKKNPPMSVFFNLFFNAFFGVSR